METERGGGFNGCCASFCNRRGSWRVGGGAHEWSRTGLKGLKPSKAVAEQVSVSP